nr:ferredoxin thioreductase subunit beta [Cryptomonas sp. NIES-345]BDA98388.1 ferredoxin thioreductase subunit beta [Cryptomonas sp. NIES-1327]
MMNNVTPESLQAMQKFSETYAKKTGTFFCSDLTVTAIVIQGLARHKDEYGAPLCPCRHYNDKLAEVSATYWNCPCVPMRERKECHCMLFLTEDNEFSSNMQEINLYQIKRI